MSIITKAVFPVAGLGTRFLPATKANPKEMLPVVDKPLIQYAVDEAVRAGIKELIFVTSSSKRAIEDHFDKNYELERELERKGKDDLLKLLRDVVPPDVTCIYIRQAEALGLGHAILCARSVVGNDPFAVLLADDLIDGERGGCLAQMVEQFQRLQASILGVEQVPIEDTSSYGIVELAGYDGRLARVQGIVEKPKAEDAPSDMAVVGRYILSPEIFSILAEVQPGKGGEIQLTDGIAKLMEKRAVYSYEFDGRRYDCGSKIGYLQATVDYALKHSELGEEFEAFLKGKLCRLQGDDQDT